MIGMTLAILGATFLGCYGAVKLCIWEENRKPSPVDEYDEYDEFDEFDEFDKLLDELDADLDKLNSLDEAWDFDERGVRKNEYSY